MWMSKQFLTCAQAALFSVPDNKTGRLEKRTLFECDLRSLLLYNDTAMKKVIAAAHKTHENEPILMGFLPLEDRWHILNAVLNKISSIFALGYLSLDMHLPVRQAWYLFTLVCERYEAATGRSFCHKRIRAESGDVQSIKIRVFVVAEATVGALLRGDIQEPVEFQNKRHEMRWRTLRRVAEGYQNQQCGGGQVLLRVLITLPDWSSPMNFEQRNGPTAQHPHSIAARRFDMGTSMAHNMAGHGALDNYVYGDGLIATHATDSAGRAPKHSTPGQHLLHASNSARNDTKPPVPTRDALQHTNLQHSKAAGSWNFLPDAANMRPLARDRPGEDKAAQSTKANPDKRSGSAGTSS